MTNAVVQQIAASATDSTMPLLYRDPILNKGSKFLFDFGNQFCLNGNAVGSLSAGATFLNLLDSGASASTVGSSGAFSINSSSNGLAVNGSGAGSYIDFGTSYDLSSSNDEFLVILWLKIPLSGMATGFPEIFALSSGNANAAQWWMDSASDGRQMRGVVGLGGSSSYALGIPDGAGVGSVTQFAMHWRSTGLLEVYYNGTFANSGNAAPTSLQAGSGIHLKATAQFSGNLYRAYQEDLVVSGLTAAGQILADYTLNNNRFS
jgi:hypothetical protein